MSEFLRGFLHPSLLLFYVLATIVLVVTYIVWRVKDR
jgi:hypothetical protein